MLTKEQKTLLEENIYRMLSESMFEQGFWEDSDKKYDDEDEDYDDEDYDDDEDEDDEDDAGYEETGEDSTKREIIMKWLDSAQELHSVLAYELWPRKKKGAARSLFSKKWRGEDNKGKAYSFKPSEINTLFNLRSDFINDAGLASET